MKQQRFHGLDLARALFMIMGVFYHVGLIYNGEQTWRVYSDESSLVLFYITKLLHSFRMDAFYILCGFFFTMVVQKRGTHKTIVDRILKLGIPLLFIGFTLNYGMNIFSWNRNYDNGFEYVYKGEWLGHLWFLGNLIIYNIVFSNVSSLFNFKGKRYNILVCLFFGILLSLFLEFFARKSGLSKLFFIDFITLFMYLPSYLIGIFVFKQKDSVFNMFTNKEVVAIILISLCFILCSSYLELYDHSKYLVKVLSRFGGILLAFALILTFAVFNKKYVWISNIVDASYSIYLFHQPLIVFIYVGVFSKINVESPFFIYLLFSVFISILTYFFHHHIVKKSSLLLLLCNGNVKKLKVPISTNIKEKVSHDINN